MYEKAIAKLRETLARQEAATQATQQQINAFVQLEATLVQDKSASGNSKGAK